MKERKFLFFGTRRILSYIDTAPRITGLHKQKGTALLDTISDHIPQPEFACLNKWRELSDADRPEGAAKPCLGARSTRLCGFRDWCA